METHVRRSPVDVVQQFLNNTTNAEVVHSLVASDATYISLNYDNPTLKRILPWTGTSKGPQAFLDTFAGVFRFWEAENFQILDIFGSAESVAVFGTFTYRSKTLGKAATSPFSILAKVRNEKIVYFQFMEDTYATASTFKVGGVWEIRSDPDKEAFDV